MKRVVIGLLFCLVTGYICGQDLYMYVNGQKRFFSVSTTKMLVNSELLDTIDVKSLVQRKGAVDVKRIYTLGNHLFMTDMHDMGNEHLSEMQKNGTNKSV